jgi:HSP20 family protein
MSSIFFYEPFYDFERLVDEALSAPRQIRNQLQNQVQQRASDADGAVRSFKPR